MLEDIAILTGGTMIAEDLGIKLKNATLQMLGKSNTYWSQARNSNRAIVADGGRAKPACRAASD